MEHRKVHKHFKPLLVFLKHTCKSHKDTFFMPCEKLLVITALVMDGYPFNVPKEPQWWIIYTLSNNEKHPLVALVLCKMHY